MKKALKILCVFALLACFTLPLFGCEKDSEDSGDKITMAQIFQATGDAGNPVVKGDTFDGKNVETSDAQLILNWQIKLERNGIDTRYFGAVDTYKYYSKTKQTRKAYVYVLKFATIASAKNCEEKVVSAHNYYEDNVAVTYGEEYVIKRYDKLVIVADYYLADFFFDIVDSI
jgi:hypothetical protein